MRLQLRDNDEARGLVADTVVAASTVANDDAVVTAVAASVNDDPTAVNPVVA